MNSPLLVFTTDFGLADSYAGVMKGVALGINPDLRFIDLTHQVSPQNIAQGAFVLGVSHRYFPPHAIHVAVVDPGVGTDRRPILLETPRGTFIAPDNGLLSRVLDEHLPEQPASAGPAPIPSPLRAWHLTNPDYWLHPVSRTFHGRDVFTPVAAHLSRGVPADTLGERTSDLHFLPQPQPRMEADRIRGEIIYVDTYGNLVSSIPEGALAGRTVSGIRIRGRAIPGISGTFNDGEPASGLVALVGSHGYLEVAVPNGSAADTLSAGAGEPVTVAVVPA